MNSRIYTAPVPKMPPGLIELMEGLARDVLKNNPSDIFDFCSKHVEKLLKIRDGDVTKKGMTLAQKIARAQEKIRHRSELRQKNYDKEIQSLNVNEENQISSKIEAVDNKIEPIYNRENSAEIATEDNLDKPTEIAVAYIGNAEDKRETEIENSDVECQKDTSENELSFEITEINSKNATDELQNGVGNRDYSEYSIERSGDLKDQNEFVDSKNISTLTEKNNLDSVITNTIIEDDDVNHTCHAVTLVENENCSTATNEDIDIYLQPNEKTNEDINCTQKVKVTSVLEDSNEDQERSIDAIPEDSLIAGTMESSINNSEIFVTTLNFNNASKEKDSDTEAENDFSNDMDLEKAAITIQKVFRSFLFRSKTSSVDDSTNVDINQLIEDTNNEKHKGLENTSTNKDKKALGLSRMDTVLQTVNEEKSLSLSTDDSSTLSSAATIIQAHVRGFLVRNKLNLNKTISTTSNIDSDIQSPKSLEKDINNHKSKTILNIHIVPEGGNYLSRDESMMTSLDLPFDGSPPHTANLHPLGYDRSERRKQLKREDAIQSISPPSNNSGKSEDIESVKEILPHGDITDLQVNPLVQSSESDTVNINHKQSISNDKVDINNFINDNDKTQSNISLDVKTKLNNSTENNTDEMDVITPFVTIEDNGLMELNKSRLLNSGEFHDIVLPTMVSRSNTSVVREFQNVLVYFLLWNNP